MLASLRRWLKWFVVFAVIGTPAVYLLIAKSEAFAAASTFLRGSPEVARLLGPISDASLSWRGASMRQSGDSGEAHFTVTLEGQENTGRAYVELRKRGIWEVRFARLIPDAGAPVVLLDAGEPRLCGSRC
jgi:hypothetical protein